MTVTSKTAKKERAKPIPGIVRDAKLLGCDRWHLMHVLRGDRKSKVLIERYLKLKREQAEKAKQSSGPAEPRTVLATPADVGTAAGPDSEVDPATHNPKTA